MFEYHHYRESFNVDRARIFDVANLIAGEVRVEEKIDGSQCSVRKLTDGTMEFYSKRNKMTLGMNKNFNAAFEFLDGLQDQLCPEYTYRGEVISKPKHNKLKYGRTPKGNFILFDVDTPNGPLLRNELEEEADEIGLEVVPLIFKGKFENAEDFLYKLNSLLDTDSCLGEVKVEGLTIKPESRDIDKRLLGKLVSQEFRENHSAKLKQKSGINEVIDKLGASVALPARFEKAIKSMEEDGIYAVENKQIGEFIKRVNIDVNKEETENLKETLWQAYRKPILSTVSKLAVGWFQERLTKLP